MNQMSFQFLAIVLSLVGAFGTLALGINAFFLKGIYTKQNEIELKVVMLITIKESMEKDVDTLKNNEIEIFRRLNKLEKVV